MSKSNKVIINIKRVNERAKIPSQANPTDAGYDLYAVEEAWIKPGQRSKIDTGIQISIPAGYYGRVAPRSGLAIKNGIDVLAGVVDATYRGNIMVVLINLHDGDEADAFKVNVGDRIAQIIIEKCHEIHFNEVSESLDETPRGIGGFGSSGI
jgi:dUTP pyrophosphatase